MILFPVSYWWCRWVVARIPFSPGGAAGADFAFGLLGAHRVCVWTIFDFAEKHGDDSRGYAWLFDCYGGDGDFVRCADADEGAWGGDDGVVSACFAAGGGELALSLRLEMQVLRQKI